MFQSNLQRLDVTKSTKIFKEFSPTYTEVEGVRYFTDAYLTFLGDTIREEVKSEIGVTVSCGVSFNKAFAKLGSDLRSTEA